MKDVIFNTHNDAWSVQGTSQSHYGDGYNLPKLLLTFSECITTGTTIQNCYDKFMINL